MALFHNLLFSVCILLGFVSAAPTAEGSFSISAYRDYADEQTRSILSKRRSQQTGNLSTYLDTSLYWFGQFNVGDATNLSLLIDTGSSDLLLNNGEYKPSKYETPYNGDVNFSITYEGVDRQGFGFETVNGTLQNDIVSAGGLTVTQQVLGNITSFEYFDVPPLPYANQGQGIIGFAAQGGSVFNPPGRPWFWNLCSEKTISVCRFALAFGTSGIGQMIIGKLATNLITGNIISLPNIGGNGTYAVIGDVTLNNSIVLSNQTIIMDVGTDNIQSPIPQAQQLFDLLNYPTQLLSEAPTPFDPGVAINVLNGFFDCTNPPTLGFSFPAQDQLEEGQTATIFNVSPDVWGVFNNSATNCTSILGGTNGITVGNVSAWLLGQSFFAGHYIDFHLDNNNNEIISFANLVNPTDGSAGGWSSWS